MPSSLRHTEPSFQLSLSRVVVAGCQSILIQSLCLLRIPLTVLNLDTRNRQFGKQRRPKWNATKDGISAGSALFAQINIFLVTEIHPFIVSTVCKGNSLGVSSLQSLFLMHPFCNTTSDWITTKICNSISQVGNSLTSLITSQSYC